MTIFKKTLLFVLAVLTIFQTLCVNILADSNEYYLDIGDEIIINGYIDNISNNNVVSFSPTTSTNETNLDQFLHTFSYVSDENEDGVDIPYKKYIIANNGLYLNLSYTNNFFDNNSHKTYVYYLNGHFGLAEAFITGADNRHMWSDGTKFGHYNSPNTEANSNMQLDLYKKNNDGSFAKLESLDEIENGGTYLIASKKTADNKIMTIKANGPSDWPGTVTLLTGYKIKAVGNGTTTFEVNDSTYTIHVGDLTDKVNHYMYPGENITISSKANNISTGSGSISIDELAQGGTNQSYNGDFVSLSDCLYTFEKVEDGKYKIYHDNLSLLVSSTNNEIYHQSKDNAEKIEITAFNTSEGLQFNFHCGTRSIYFQYDDNVNEPYLNRWGQKAQNSGYTSLLFHLYQFDSSTNKYEAISEVPADGLSGEYLIVQTTNGGKNYVVKPDLTIDKFKQIVKWNKNSNFAINAIKEGTGKLNYNGKTHLFNVVSLPSASDIQSKIVSKTGLSNSKIINELIVSKGLTYTVDKDINSDISWASSNINVATVSSDGVITTVNSGVCYIGYLNTSTGDKYSMKVTVIDGNDVTSIKDLNVELKDVTNADVKIGSETYNLVNGSEIYVDAANKLEFTLSSDKNDRVFKETRNTLNNSGITINASNKYEIAENVAETGTLSFGSAPKIEMKTNVDYTADYAIKVDAVDVEVSNKDVYKTKFSLNEKDFNNSFFKEIYVTKNNIKVAGDVELEEAVQIEITIPEAYRDFKKYVVKSYHGGSIITWDILEEKNNKITIEADKFSDFVITGYDKKVKGVDLFTYLAPNTSVH